MNQAIKIRIKFAKYGTMKFIGHLDIMRFFQKAIRRADIDIRYSGGFSPHQIMSFAAPLGVGIESQGEYLDIEVNSMTTTEDMKNALNQTMVPGIEIVAVTVLPDTVKNAMASVAAAAYRITYKEGSFPIENMEQKLQEFYAKEQILVTKETKKSVLELDLKPGIYELKVVESDEEVCTGNINDSTERNPAPEIYMLVDASSSGNIKPTMVLDAFCDYCNVRLEPYSYQVTRIDTYTNLAKEGKPRKLVPLEAVGI